MNRRAFASTLGVAAALAVPGAALADATGTVPGLRAQVVRLLTAELHHDSSTVCAILNAPMNGTLRGVPCTTRWTRSLERILSKPGARAALRADIASAASAAVSSDGIHASITLPHPLLGGESRFYWTNNCWMLMR